MATTLTVTNDPDYSHATVPTASSVQQTNSADDLGFHSTPPADAAPVDDKLMDFLRSESAGSTFETKKVPKNNSLQSYELAGIGAVILLMMAVLVIFYRRWIHNQSNIKTIPKRGKKS